MSQYAQHFALAAELGQSLHDLLGWPGPMTHRQFLAWQIWRAEQWNIPSRSDWYAMATRAEVRSVIGAFSKNPPTIRMEELKLKFTASEPEVKAEQAVTPQEREARSRAVWGAVLGGPTTPIPVNRNQAGVGPPRAKPRKPKE